MCWIITWRWNAKSWSRRSAEGLFVCIPWMVSALAMMCCNWRFRFCQRWIQLFCSHSSVFRSCKTRWKNLGACDAESRHEGLRNGIEEVVCKLDAGSAGCDLHTSLYHTCPLGTWRFRGPPFGTNLIICIRLFPRRIAYWTTRVDASSAIYMLWISITWTFFIGSALDLQWNSFLVSLSV